METIEEILFAAARNEDLKTIERYTPLCLSIKNSKNETLLHVAAGYGKRNVTNYLIAQGANVNAQDDEGLAPLHNACCHGHYTTSEILIRENAEVNLVDNKGWSPLHWALARKDNAERISQTYWKVTDLLIESGADPHLRSNSGRSCFYRIKNSDDKRSVKLKYLLNQLKFNHFDGTMEREQLIDSCLNAEDYFELVKEGDIRINELKLVTTSKMLRSQLESYDNITPLHRAAGYNHLEVAEYLINEGADVNATDSNGRIPLHNASQYGHVDMIELLISKKSNINTQDSAGFSPLHVAASNITYQACLLLLEKGADNKLKCREGNMPYDLADSGDVREVLRPKEPEIVSATDLAIYVDLPQVSRENPVIYSSILDRLMLDSSSDKPLFNSVKHKIKKVLLRETDECYRLIKRAMSTTIMSHENDLGGSFSSYEIIGIEQILNQKVWDNYRLMCKIVENEFGYKNEKILFHGSNFIDNIQNHGFDERYAQRNGMFGTGIYFAKHSSKSNQYTFGLGQGCLKHLDKSCYECERKMIFAQVALGRSLISKVAMPDCSHGPPGYSSVTGKPGSTDDLIYDEYVIYKGAQAYPLFVIRYRIKP